MAARRWHPNLLSLRNSRVLVTCKSSVIINFANKLARDLVEEQMSKETRSFPRDLWRNARKKLAMLHAAKRVEEMRIPVGNRLEKLKGGRQDFYSIRINDQWRIVFRFESGNAHDVSVEDYHS